MRISDLPATELSARLASPGIHLRLGPVVSRIRSSIPHFVDDMRRLYADYPLEPDPGFVDFHIRVAKPRGLRRWLRPQVLFYVDDRPPFRPLPASKAFPMFEWGLNWCVAGNMHRYLILHSAVIERHGGAVIMPGSPGFGKSTLCAALVSRGWRLLSDEMAILDLQDGSIIPAPRPISLKNESIEIIRRFAPQAVIGRKCVDTHKGTVSHMKAPADSVQRAGERARAAYVISPRFEAGAATVLEPESKGHMFMHLIQNAFNYHIHGARGFRLVGDIVEKSRCYRLTYQDLQRAVQLFDTLPPPDTAH